MILDEDLQKAKKYMKGLVLILERVGAPQQKSGGKT